MSLYRVLDTCRYFAGAGRRGGDKVYRRTSHGAVSPRTATRRSVSLSALAAIIIMYSLR